MAGRSAAFAVIADVHGNRWALEAVLHRIRELGIPQVLNLGDSLYGPLDPAGTADRLMQPHIVSIQGNEDRILVEEVGGGDHSPSLAFTRSCLQRHHLDWLASLPRTRTVGEAILMFHGTPERDDEYLFWDVKPSGPVRRSPEAVGRKLVGYFHPVVLAGHDHKPTLLRGSGDRVYANPGSVGLPAYYDQTPPHHIMENGTPHARFAVLLDESGRWRLEYLAVKYDWDAASQAAIRNGRRDWSQWLQTGRVWEPEISREPG